jgi:hypothetical protein
MAKDKKKMTKNLPKRKFPHHKQKRLGEKRKIQAERDSFTAEREKSKPILVSTGDLKEDYEIIGPVYFQTNSKGWFSSKPLNKLIEDYQDFFEKNSRPSESPKLGTWSELASAFFLGEISLGKSNLFDSAFYISIEELKYRAYQLGADAIINMRQDIDLDSNMWQNFYMQMYGTAVRICSAE